MESLRKLTIAIPTFNRYTDLRISLGAIKKQLSNLDFKIASLINIHVQVNASNDNSFYYLSNSSISNEIKNTGALFTYEINSENYGFDKNVSLCIENCLSEYIWIISDDDTLYEDAINKVLLILKDNISMINLLFEQIPFYSKDKPLRRDCYYENYSSDKSLSSILRFPKLSVFIYKTEIAKKLLPLLDYNSYFIHLELALRIALNPNYNCFYSSLFIGEDNCFYTSKTNDYSPYIFNNIFIIIKRLSKDFERDDLMSILKKIIPSFVDPVITTLKLLIFKNLNMHNIKKSTLDDSKRRLSSQIYFLKYINLPRIILYFFGFLLSYIISILFKFIYLIKSYLIRIILKIIDNKKILNFLLKRKEVLPKKVFLKRVNKPNIIVLVGKFKKEDLVSNFKNISFKDSKFLIFNDLKIDYLEVFNQSKIKFINQFILNNSMVTYSDNNSGQRTNIRLSESNDLTKLKGRVYSIEEYFLDIEAISRIDLLLINENDFQSQFIKEFESLVRFIKFIVVNFSQIKSSNIDQFYWIIKTLEDNQHKLYFQTSFGLIPISKLKKDIYGLPIKLIGILNP